MPPIAHLQAMQVLVCDTSLAKNANGLRKQVFYLDSQVPLGLDLVLQRCSCVCSCAFSNVEVG